MISEKYMDSCAKLSSHPPTPSSFPRAGGVAAVADACRRRHAAPRPNLSTRDAPPSRHPLPRRGLAPGTPSTRRNQPRLARCLPRRPRLAGTATASQKTAAPPPPRSSRPRMPVACAHASQGASARRRSRWRRRGEALAKTGHCGHCDVT